MSSRAAAGRKRLQQPKPPKPPKSPKSNSLKAAFIKNFTSDGKSSNSSAYPSPPLHPSALENPHPIAPSSSQQPYYSSDASDAEDAGIGLSSSFAPEGPHWHPQTRTASNSPRKRGFSEVVDSSPATRLLPTPPPSHPFQPYPSPPSQSRGPMYLRGASPSASSLINYPSTSSTASVSSEGTVQHAPLLFQPDSRHRYPAHTYPSTHPSHDSIASSAPSSYPLINGYPNHYPSPPSSNSDPVSPLSLSPLSTEQPSLPSLMAYSESSSDSASTRSGSRKSSSSLAVNAPSIFSSSSGSGESIYPISPSKASPGFVYPSSRSVGRPTANGPKFKFKSKKGKTKSADVEATGLPNVDEGNPSAHDQRQQVSPRPRSSPVSNGLRISVAGPSSISRPSFRSPRTPNSASMSSGSSTRSSDSGFVFPTARSRAHPNGPPLKFRKKRTLSENGDDEVDRSAQKFMGISLNRKKKSSMKAQSPGIPSDVYPRDANLQHIPETPTPTAAYFEEERVQSMPPEPGPSTPQLPPKLGTYPLDPYDSTLLENDKSTYALLRRLNSTNMPSFCHYGNDPPSSVLDLGCGQGHWILEAATTWKGYGTQITGLDIADTMKSLRPLAVRNGVADNIKFVRGNFLKQPLPFNDESFDLVRMANLTYAMSYDKWDFVLGEICRVLTVGGRLELIDDHIFFPYGKAPLSAPSPSPPMSEQGPRSGSHERDDEELYDLYGTGAEDDGEASDTATLTGNAGPSGRQPPPTRRTMAHGTPAPLVPVQSVEALFWSEQMDASQELEMLFEHLMNLKFGIHLCPSEFILEMLSQIFGHSREVKTMHLTIAPPDMLPDASSNSALSDSKVALGRSPDVRGRQDSQTAGQPYAHENSNERNSLELSPGLLLWPSTLLPMSHTELLSHASKHPRTLLSCKAALSEYATESADADIEDEAVLEALWEYEGFLDQRLNPPAQTSEPLSMLQASTSSASVATERGFVVHNRAPSVDSESVYSVSSVSSDARSAMWDYDFELRHHFAWPLETRSTADTIVPPSNGSQTLITASPTPTSSHTSTAQRHTRSHSASSDTQTISAGSPGFPARQADRESVAPPDYSVNEPTHVRTFHVYEAIKMDARLLSPVE